MPDTTDEFDAPVDDHDVVDLDSSPVVKSTAESATTDAEPLPDDQLVEDGKPSSKREARYRVQLREAEAERDNLRATVESMQRAEVERIAGKTIRQPAALWAAGVVLSDLLDDTGAVDTQKVDDAAQQARTNLGLTKPWAAPNVPREGTSVHQPSGGGNAWEDAFKV